MINILMPVLAFWGFTLALCAVGCLICSPFLVLEALLNRHFDKQAQAFAPAPFHAPELTVSKAKPAPPAPISVGVMTAIEGPFEPKPNAVHLDECVGDRHGDLFERDGIDVTRTRQVGLVGESDVEQLSFAYGEMRVLITFDSDFIDLNARGLPHCGILRVPNNASPETILKTYRSVWG